VPLKRLDSDSDDEKSLRSQMPRLDLLNLSPERTKTPIPYEFSGRRISMQKEIRISQTTDPTPRKTKRSETK
jgi:hypothetical protein